VGFGTFYKISLLSRVKQTPGFHMPELTDAELEPHGARALNASGRLNAPSASGWNRRCSSGSGAKGPGYLNRINELLREAMERSQKRTTAR
jgi:hypothetical protein